MKLNFNEKIYKSTFQVLSSFLIGFATATVFNFSTVTPFEFFKAGLLAILIIWLLATILSFIIKGRIK